MLKTKSYSTDFVPTGSLLATKYLGKAYSVCLMFEIITCYEIRQRNLSLSLSLFRISAAALSVAVPLEAAIPFKLHRPARRWRCNTMWRN